MRLVAVVAILLASCSASASPPAEKPKRETLETIAHLLEQAYTAFDQRQFDKTIKLCDEMIAIDPRYTVAVELSGFKKYARQVEALTINLVSVNRRYKVHAGVRVTDV